MIGRKLALSVAAIVLLSGSALAGTFSAAQAATLLSSEEHWRYSIDRWLWDSDRRRSYGIITPQIVIENETADRLEGYIADANSTRLDMYDGEQIVQIRFMSDRGITSSWEVAGRVNDGYFVIEIPERYKQAEVVRIFIGNHRYTVSDGTLATPPTEVFINSGILNYRTNATLDQIVGTEVAQVQEPEPVSSILSRGSLIDYILSKHGLLPV